MSVMRPSLMPRPRPKRSRLAVLAPVLGGAFLAALASGACTEDTSAQYACTDIPAGGCPLSRGVACEDPSCAAVYACRVGNVWELDHACPAHDAGARPDAAAADAGDASPIGDASIDAPPGAYGGPGCSSLQTPDCALGVALGCATSGSCCDCEDLYVCENGGWSLWGSCSADAGVQPTRGARRLTRP
ncbi:MAG: hypothetical protein JWP97_1357 [Labilithrix sp.]|nr:hypothetical protein [Labilithrix sp.]